MGGLISPGTIEQIRGASDIVDVIGGSLPLKRAGANFVTLCPFHREKSPSFNVNPQKQIFHCFGCHKGGDVFRFIQDYENLSFIEAVRRLADRAGIPIQLDEGGDGQQIRFLKETLWQMHEAIAQRWQAALQNDAAGEIARTYLAKRGVSDEAIKLFRLGYAPELWDDTVNWAKSKSYELPAVEQAGLIIRREGSEGYYDRFRGRLMFPICDEQGRVIAFSGRILSGDEKTAKYVNSPETPIFTKGRVFYGLDKSKRAILDAEFAIICEGQLDLIACYTAGIRNIVAPQGTAFTPEHARILKRYVNEVVLCFDSDNAGQNAAVRVLDSLTASGLAVRVAVVPSPHDPDSFIKEFGGSAFEQLIKNAPGFFDFFLARLCATNDPASDKGRLEIVAEMGAALARTGNAVLMDTYAAKTAQRLAVLPDAVRAEFKKGSPGQQPRVNKTNENANAALPAITEPEYIFLRLLLDTDEYVPWIAERLDLDWIKNPLVKEIVSRRLESFRDNSWINVSAFLSQLQNSLVHQLVSEVLTSTLILNLDGTRNRVRRVRSLQSHGDIPRPVEQLESILIVMRNDVLNEELTRLHLRLTNSDISDEDKVLIVRRREHIRGLKRAPLHAAAES